MEDSVLNDISHRRYNPLRDTWLLVSPHRTKRPWQSDILHTKCDCVSKADELPRGQQETPSRITLPDYDAQCYLCPGNKRAQGDANPLYENTFVFVNDYSAVKETQAEYTPDVEDGDLSSILLRANPVTGKCYVLTFSPKHNLTLADLPIDQLIPVIQKWTEIYASHYSTTSLLADLCKPSAALPQTEVPRPNSQYRWMQIFENKGAAMGCSNPHPHGQIWVTSGTPEEASSELSNLITYRHKHGDRHMLEDYAKLEIKKKERVVFQNETFLVVCPWWATWPFEVMVLSRAHKRALVDLSQQEVKDFAECIAEVTRRYDNLFECSFPYSSGIHQAPLESSDAECNASHLHMHFYPPLLRSATVRKFLVGYELMAESQRDITPEQAAEKLRNCGGELYRSRLD